MARLVGRVGDSCLAARRAVPFAELSAAYAAYGLNSAELLEPPGEDTKSLLERACEGRLVGVGGRRRGGRVRVLDPLA